MKEKTCCFTGHRHIPEDDLNIIKNKLKKEVIKLIDQGVCYFGAGGALGFDTIAAQTVLELKNDYPNIKLILVLPCKNQTYHWQEKDKKVFEDIKKRCDKYVYTSEEYNSQCMKKRNRHLVDNSSYCICYLTRDIGGTAYTVHYAQKKGLEIINIADIANIF